MTEHNPFLPLRRPCIDAQFLLLKAAALYLDKLGILKSVGASGAAIGTDHRTRETVKRFFHYDVERRSYAQNAKSPSVSIVIPAERVSQPTEECVQAP